MNVSLPDSVVVTNVHAGRPVRRPAKDDTPLVVDVEFSVRNPGDPRPVSAAGHGAIRNKAPDRPTGESLNRHDSP